MFVLRSAFWLTLGFVLVAPHGTDFGAGATALKDQAVEAGLEAGQQLIVSQISNNALPDLLVSVATASLDASPAALPAGAILPRPRPASLS
jgi:hypothetical protein